MTYPQGCALRSFGFLVWAVYYALDGQVDRALKFLAAANAWADTALKTQALHDDLDAKLVSHEGRAWETFTKEYN